jgi:hypothetical protein
VILRLLRLLVLKQTASVRHFVRSLRTPRRWFSLLSVALFVALFVWKGLGGGGAAPKESVQVLAAMFWVMAIAGGFVQQGPRFTPSDVDFLFPAPFTPRDLLVWRLMHQWLFSFVSAGVLLLVTARGAAHPGRLFVGIYLLQVTSFHAQVAIAVYTTKLGDAAARRLRGVGRAVALAVLFAGMVYFVRAVQPGGVQSLVATAMQSDATKFLFFPATKCADFVFAEPARSAAWALFGQLVGALATLALLLAPAVDFLEESVATTERFSKLLASRRRGVVTPVVEEGQRARSGAVPATRLLFRASGAIVWKNLLVAIRSWKSVLPSLVIGSMFVLPLFVLNRMRDDVGLASLGLYAPLVMVTLYWSNAVGFDLRRELDRLDQLRLLPIPSSAIVLAELLLPWGTGVALQELLVAALVWSGHGPSAPLRYIALALPLVTFLAVVIDNLAALFFVQRGDVGATRGSFGTSTAAQLLRMLAWGCTVVPGFLAWYWIDRRFGATQLAIFVGVFLEGTLATALFFLLVHFYETKEVELGE